MIYHEKSEFWHREFLIIQETINGELQKSPMSKFYYYENHRTVKWARIFASLPRPLSSTAPPTFFDEFRYRYHATPQWNMSRAGRVYERGQFLNEDLRRNINHDVV